MKHQQTNQELEDFLKNGGELECLKNAEFSIPEVLNEILAKTGATQSDMSKVLHLGMTQTGRVIRSDTPFLDETNLQALIETFNLPFEATLYANAAGRYKKRLGKPPVGANPALVRHEKTNPNQFEELGESVCNGQLDVYSNIRVSDIDPSTSGLLNPCDAARLFGSREFLRISCQSTRDEKSRRFLVRHHGAHMVSEEVNQSIIPDRAIIEIEPIDENKLLTGDIVFVQIGTEGVATSYVYNKKVTTSGVIEYYEPWSNKYPTRPCIEAVGAGIPLSRQRIIFGKVIRIVDYRISD
jgi:hypothetical protein